MAVVLKGECTLEEANLEVAPIVGSRVDFKIGSYIIRLNEVEVRELMENVIIKGKPPVVIEGGGRMVKLEETGYYWVVTGSGYKGIINLTERNWFYTDTRYIKVAEPVFPPLLPLKPELKLYRVKEYKDVMFWGFVDKRGRIYPGNFDPTQVEEVKDG